MHRRQKSLCVAILDSSPATVLATLQALGASRPLLAGDWQVPSEAPLVFFTVSIADPSEATRLSCARVFPDPFDVPDDPVADLTRYLSEMLNISLVAAGEFVQRITVTIRVHSSDPVAATTVLPRTACALLSSHEGYVWNQHDVWTAQAVREGQIEGMSYWPFPSVADEYAASDAVFIGKAAAELVVSSATVPAKFQVNVEDTLRGTLAPTVTVLSPRDFPMVVGKRYLLFVTRTANGYWVEPCGNSDPLTDAGATLDTIRLLSLASSPPKA